METVTGGCLCGAVTFCAEGAPLRVGICHCSDCRKHHGALFGAVAIFDEDAVKIVGETRQFRDRTFCPTCGSPVLSRTGREMELHLGAFDDPNVFEPSYELWCSRRPEWLPTFPKTARFDKNRD